eukprot:Em1085g2a
MVTTVCCHAHGRCKAGTCTGQRTAGPVFEIAFLAEVNEVHIIGLHDAIELGHQYSVSSWKTAPSRPSNALPQTVVHPFGLSCPRSTPWCEIAARHVEECCWSSDQFDLSTGVRRWKLDSHSPTRGAPIRYNLAGGNCPVGLPWSFSIWSLERTHAMGTKDVWLKGVALLSVCGPWYAQFANSTQFLNETHMKISPSLIKGAGSGLMCGFSFPVSNAPRQYDVAMEAAVAAHCGVLEIGHPMAGQEAMPWSLKEAFHLGSLL